MAALIKKNELKAKFYKMFQGKCETTIIDIVLESCECDEEKTYRSLIEMVGEQLDVSPSTPIKKKNMPVKPPPSRNTSPRNKSHRNNSPARDVPLNALSSGGTVERDCGGSASYPTNLLEQLSGAQGIEENFGSPKQNSFLPTPISSPLRHGNRPPGSPASSLFNHPPGLPNLQTSSAPAQLNFNSTSAQPRELFSTISEKKNQLPIQRPIPAPRKLPPPKKDEYQIYRDVNSLWLVLMRGLPGSGKSYKAREIAGEKGFILSTDDYFVDKTGRYLFDGTKLPEAHTWNQERARKAMSNQFSPIIIDNTHVEAWEMKPYIADGLKAGYEIDIHESNTPWAFKPNELARKNKHNVSKFAIERMLQKYQRNVTVDTVKALITGVSVSHQSSNQIKDMNPVTPRPHNVNKTMENIDFTINNTNQSIMNTETTVNSPSRDLNTIGGNAIFPKGNVDILRGIEANPGDIYFDKSYKPLSEKMLFLKEDNAIDKDSVDAGGAILRENRQQPRENIVVQTPKESSESIDQVRDSTGKILTAKQLNIRQILHDRFPSVDKDALDNVLESCGFNLEASTNYIRYSGVKQEEPTQLKTPNANETKKKSKKSKRTDEEHEKKELENIKQTPDFKEPPETRRVCQGAEVMTNISKTSHPQPSTSSVQSNNSSSKRMSSYMISNKSSPELSKSSGKIATIVDTFRDTLVSFENENTDEEPSPKKTHQQGYDNFIEFNLSFLYETFPDLSKKYCKQWLKRYNGDLIKTCDFLSRVCFQVDDLPQDEDGDIAEDFDMIDLTRENDDVTVIDDVDNDVIMAENMVAPTARPRVGGMYLSDETVVSDSSFVIAIDKTFALKMQEEFGNEDDLNDEDLEQDDFVFGLDKELAKQIYGLWTSNMRAKKRKIESLEEDERLAKKLQDEEDKATLSQENRENKGKSKKKRTYIDIDTKFTKESEHADIASRGVSSPSKNVWKGMDENRLTAVEGVSGGRLTLKQVNNREQLYRMFPGVNEESLDQVLEAAKFDLKLAESLVTSSTGAVKNTDLENDLNDQAWQKVVSPPRKRPTPSNSPSVIQIDDEDDAFQTMGSDNISYQDLRAEAELHAQQQREYLQKSAEAFQARNGGIAQYYADEARKHQMKMKEAHFRAAELMLLRRNKNYLKEQKVIDLHGLHVKEALNALENFLNNAARIRHKNVEVITGRGNHSKNGICAIRNAVLVYLKKNQYRFAMEKNCGSVRIWL